MRTIKISSYIGSLIFIGITFYLIFINVPANPSVVINATLIQIGIFLYSYYILGRLSKNMLSPYLVFMIIFYIFQNGQVILFALGLDFDKYYIEKYDFNHLMNVIIFSTLCQLSAFAGGIFSIKERTNVNFITRINYYQRCDVLRLAKKGALFTGIIALPLMLVKFYVCATAGYFAQIAFAETIPSIIKVVEKLFLSFSILILVFAEQKTTAQKVITCFLLIWSLLAVFSGDRTVGLAGISIVALHKYQIGERKHRFKKVVTLIGTGVVVLYLIDIAFSFRMQDDTDVSGLSDTIIDAISQLGFSFFPLSLTMDVCPQTHDYLYGKSMLGGLISGLIPNSFDPFGLFDVFLEWSSEPANWIVTDFSYSFGIDFSLIAECYANFGWWGWCAMFLLSAIIANLLRSVDFSQRNNLFEQYISLVLLYSWFTLPRRKSYFIYNNWFWYVLIISVILHLFISKQNKQKT